MSTGQAARVAVDFLTVRPGKGGSGGGIATYVKHLLNAIDARKAVKLEIVCFVAHDFQSHWKTIEPIRLNFRATSPIRRLLWTHVILPWLCIKHRIDILHRPIGEAPFLKFRTRVVVTVHDFMPEYYRSKTELWSGLGLVDKLRFIYFRFATRIAVRRSDHVLLPTETVADEARVLYTVTPSKTTVTYEGVSFETARSRANARSTAPVVLCVAAFHRHKGHVRAIQAFEMLCESIRGKSKLPRLRLRGHPADPEYFDSVKRIAQKSPWARQIEFVSYVEHIQLDRVYDGAAVLLQLSEYEGFGLPLIEAQAKGIPVVCSDIAVFREILRGSALYVPLGDSAAIAKALRRTLEDGNLVDTLSSRGKVNVSRFTWAQCAQRTLAVYEQLKEGRDNQVGLTTARRTTEAVPVLGIPLYAKGPEMAVKEVVHMAQKKGKKGEAKLISATGAHGLVEAKWNSQFARILAERFFINLPDGMPAVWIGKLKGAISMERCYGPDFLEGVVAHSENLPVRHFFCGGKEGVAEELLATLRSRFPHSRLVGTFSPPFVEMEVRELRELGSMINRSRADIVWIGLSTPKQEKFAERLAPFVSASFLVTVGAAFDFHAGLLRQAPLLLQQAGLEWFFRLIVEPRRLMRRYVEIVPAFLYYAILDLIEFSLTRRKEQST